MNGFITIIGLRELPAFKGQKVTSTVSNVNSGLSPFLLGPCPLYDGSFAKNMGNAWQYAKVYAEHADATGNPRAVRYPMGKGAAPLYSWWAGEKLDYLTARRRIYWPLYRDAVKGTQDFAKLKSAHESGESLVLFDYDGYDHDLQSMSLADVLLHPKKKMGHAFVLKSMLLYGADITAEEVIERERS